jgi:hypothetical protein
VVRERRPLDAGALTVRRPTRHRLLATTLLAATLLALTAGCSDDGDAAATGETTTTVPAAGGTAPTTSALTPVGDPVTRYDLAVGDCFNQYDEIDVITRVPCDAPHDAEVFHYENHPAPFGEPYPNDREMERYARRVCYAQFAAFAGVLYEVSRLEIGVITPNKENFEDSKARYRGITCYVHDEAGEDLVGTMRNRGE